MPLRKHAREISIIRYLRAAGPLPRRHRVPRQQQPDQIRREYYRAILPFLAPAREAFANAQQYILHLLEDERRITGRMDSPARVAQALEVLQRAADKAEDRLPDNDVRLVALKFGRRTDVFQKEQLDRQTRAAIGIPLGSIEKPITDKMEAFAKTNVDLISTVPDRYFERMTERVRAAFESGIHPDELAQQFIDVDGMAEDDARRIARDQIGKLNGQLNEERQVSMGVTGYIWETARDQRVRDEHSDRQGQHFEWDNPPEDGHPGEPIQCRCFASPDFSPILEGAEEQ